MEIPLPGWGSEAGDEERERERERERGEVGEKRRHHRVGES